jgi:hypothetical protein
MQLRVTVMKFSTSIVSAFAMLAALTQPSLADEACKVELRAPAAQCTLQSKLRVTAARPGNGEKSPGLACAIEKSGFSWRMDKVPRNDGRALACFAAESSQSRIAAVTQ